MDFRDTPAEAEFRAELRDWYAANAPAWGTREQTAWDVEEWRAWSRRLFEAGYAGLTWPSEYGGRGAGYNQQAIYLEEEARSGAPTHMGVIGLGMAGPTIIAHGTAEQKAQHLRAILSAEEIFCQGFSEPNAGSDLAAVRTSAEPRGDHYLVNGQKVWSSYAHLADYCILVTRSDPRAEKHQGLTYLLVDVHSPGVEVRPLRQITGDPEFNEIFFTDVRVPVENRVGAEGGGWQVAMTTLLHERGTLGFALTSRLEQGLNRLLELARTTDAARDDAVIRDRIAQQWIDLQALRYTNYRSLSALVRTGVPGPEGSVAGSSWSESNQRLGKLALEIEGLASQLDGDGGVLAGYWQYQQLRSRGNTIEAGTSEILRNIIAERVLGLPPVTLMDFSFTPEQELLRSSVRDLLSSVSPLEGLGTVVDSDLGWNPETWPRLVDQGLVGIGAPEASGGMGLGFVEEAVVFEELGRGLYPGPYYSTVGLALPLVLAGAANDPQAIQPLLAGRRTATVAHCEDGGPASFSDSSALRCTAKQEAGQWRLTGVKRFVPDLAIVDEVIVVAMTEWGPGAWIVDLRAQREAVLPRSTMDRSRSLGDLVLDGTPATPLLSPGSQTLTELERLSHRAAAALACEAVGIAQRALELSRDYVSQRQQFDRPIGTYQAISHKVANIFVALELSRSLAYWAAWCVSVGDPAVEMACAAAKAAAAESAVSACESAIQALGGMGFTWEQPLHRLYKRAQAIDAFEGHARHHRALIARRLLDVPPANSLNGSAVPGLAAVAEGS